MKLKSKVSLLAGAIALAGVVYMPQASATVVSQISSPITVPGAGTFFGLPTNLGSFTDFLNFTVAATAGVGVQAQSVSWLFNTQGVDLTSVTLYNTTDLTTALASTGSNPIVPTTGPFGAGSSQYNGAFSFSPLLATPASYTLKIVADGKSMSGFYSGTVVTGPVPEPEEWAMMLVGAGLVSYQVRRKQKGMGKSVLAA